VVSRTDYRTLQEEISYFAGRNIVLCRKKYRTLQEEISYFAGRNIVLCRKKLASTQSWSNVFNIIFNVIIKDDVLTTTTSSTG
jgi:hypothetical protein